MTWPQAVLAMLVLSLVGCQRRPEPATRDHELKDLGLTITLPGGWRGGRVEGAGYIFASDRADCSLSFGDGLVGIAANEAGARAFLERAGAVPQSTTAQRFGRWNGVAGAGTLRDAPGTRIYFGSFPGPRGAVWTQLTARGRPAEDADALWRSIVVSPR